MYWNRDYFKTSALSTVMFAMFSIMLSACTGPTTNRNILSQISPISLQTGQTLAVIGINMGQLNGVNKESLQNSRIGFGLNDLLTQSLSDSNKFRIIAVEVRKSEQLEDMVNKYWIERQSAYSEQELPSIAMQLRVELLAYGTISYKSFEKEAFIGPFSRIEQRLQVTVKACLYKASMNETICHEGMGEGLQKGMAIIYKFSGDHIEFEKSAAGIATKEAVMAAVKRLIENIHFNDTKE
jgi:hypothetical protein